VTAEHSQQLTPAEEEAFRLAADGLTNAEIARRLSKDAKTVGKQLQQVWDKLPGILPPEVFRAITGSLESAKERQYSSDKARSLLRPLYRAYVESTQPAGNPATGAEIIIRIGLLERLLKLPGSLRPGLVARVYFDILADDPSDKILLALIHPLRADESHALVSKLETLSSPSVARQIARNLVEYVDRLRGAEEGRLLFGGNQGTFYLGCLGEYAPLDWLERVAIKEEDHLLRTSAVIALGRLGRSDYINEEVENRGKVIRRVDRERTAYWMSYAGDQGYSGYPPRDLGGSPTRAIIRQIDDVLRGSFHALLHLHELVAVLEERPGFIGKNRKIRDRLGQICSLEPEDFLWRREILKLKRILDRERGT